MEVNSSIFGKGQSNSVFDAAKLTIFDGGQSTGSIYGENQSPGSTFRQSSFFGGTALTNTSSLFSSTIANSQSASNVFGGNSSCKFLFINILEVF